MAAAAAAPVPGASAGSSWLADLRAYEHAKRRDVHPGLFEKPAKGASCAEVQEAEREFDPIRQQFRETDREARCRVWEAEERVRHLNRARDVQIRREKRDFDIVNLEGRIDPLLRQQESSKGRASHGLKPAKMSIPSTNVDYNILSNVPFDEHHWAPPDQRPRAHQRKGKQRLVPKGNLKEYNILSNRYLEDHDEKMYRDQEVTLRECAQLYRREKRFDPVLQRLTDAREEARARAAEDARGVEQVLDAEARQPLYVQGRESKGFDLITHRAREPELLQALDAAEQARTARFNTRHAFERAVMEHDIVLEEAAAAAKVAGISHERVLATTRRGHDIISNQPFGNGHGCKPLPAPQTKPPPEIWDKVMTNHLSEGAPAGIGGTGYATATLPAMRMNVPHARHAPLDLSGSLTSRASLQDSAAARRGGLASTGGGASSARGPARGSEPAWGAPPAPPVPGTPARSSEYSRPR